ncbi:hypothetical protein BH10PSE19_BH10PSE19_08520 [soil metagenome]
MKQNIHNHIASACAANQQQQLGLILLTIGLSISFFVWLSLSTPTISSKPQLNAVSLATNKIEAVKITDVFAPRPFLQIALQQAAPQEPSKIEREEPASAEAISTESKSIVPPVTLANLGNSVGNHIQKLYGLSQKHLSYAVVHIKHSLHKDARNAGLPAKLVMQLKDIFKEKINLANALRRGDSLSILYQKDGKKSRESHIVAAKLSVKGKDYSAVRYIDATGHKGYYTPAGVNLHTTFLRTPLHYDHISSGFTQARKHPILNIVRPHKGVDFAAAIGTPIKAAGYGKITYSNQKGGYGKTIIIQHDSKYSTLYAHLSRFAKGIRAGKSIQEGQVIGYVGHSGCATGSHLHYEFHIDGVAHNPLSVTLPRNSLPDSERHKFTSYAQNVIHQFGDYQKVLLASNSSKIDL